VTRHEVLVAQLFVWGCSEPSSPEAEREPGRGTAGRKGMHARAVPSIQVLTMTALVAFLGCGPPPAPEEPPGPSIVVVDPSRPTGTVGPRTCLPPATTVEPGCEGTLGTAGAAATARAERLMVEGRALHDGDDYRGCGSVYLEAALAHPERDRAADAAYGACLCLFSAIAAEQRSRESRRPRRSKRGSRRRAEEGRFDSRPLTGVEEQAVRAAWRYLCLRPADDEDAISVAYRRARILYIANHLEEGAHAFRRIAFEHPDHDLSEYAANLYLDSLNSLATRDPARAELCRTAILTEAAALSELYCTSVDRGRHDELCYILDRLGRPDR